MNYQRFVFAEVVNYLFIGTPLNYLGRIKAMADYKKDLKCCI